MSDSSCSYSSSYEGSQENFNDYKPGGYAPISIGELLNNRYKIIKKIGFGVFSVVYLTYDYDTTTYCALKVYKSSKEDTKSAQTEINILDKINSEYCCQKKDNFVYHSIFGDHTVIVFIMYGENLYHIITMYRYNGLPINSVKKICLKILLALRYIHDEINLINTDLKPENILIKNIGKRVKHIMKMYKISPKSSKIKLCDRHVKTMSKSQSKRYKRLKINHNVKEEECSSEDEDELEERISDIVIADFGNACPEEEHYSESICTRHYKPPENILDINYTASIDIWSFGCIIYELLTGDLLFDPVTFYKGDKREINDNHLASIIEITKGNLSIYSGSSEYEEYVNTNGDLRFIRHLKKINMFDKIKKITSYSNIDCEEWSEFILYALEFDSKKKTLG